MHDRNEQYRDRKLELGISEILGAERPPDLSNRILAADDDHAAPAAKPEYGRWRRWLPLAVAASLLLAFAGFVASVEWSWGPGGRGDRVVASVDSTKGSMHAEDAAETEETIDAAKFVSEPENQSGRLLAEFEKEHGLDEFLSEVENQKKIQAEILQAEIEASSSGEREAERRLPVAKLREPLALQQRNALERRNDVRGLSEQEALSRLESAQPNLVAVEDGVADLRGRIRAVELDKDEQFRRVVRLTDKVHQSRAIRARLEERNQELAAELARRRELMNLKGISSAAPPESTPSIANVIVTATSKSGFVEISAGSDDGLRDGHLLDVSDGSQFLGRIVIRKTSPNRAVGVIMPEFRKGDIKKGDRVSTRSSDIPTNRESDTPAAEADQPQSQPQPQKTWRRAVASPNATRLVIGDEDELLPAGLQANVVVDGFRARVLLDWYYYNNRGRRLEGNFKLRLPNEASLYYLAFGPTSIEYRPQGEQLASRGFLTPDLLRSAGTGPQEILSARRTTWDRVKEARLVPRQQAAYAYSETVRRRVDPALAEWSGAGVFQCRVFPLEPGRLHRIVVGYDVNLTRQGDDLVYHFDVPQGLPECAIDMNIAALPGLQAELMPAARPYTSGARAYYHFDQPSGDKITLRMTNPETVLLTGSDELAGEFFATQVQPQFPAGGEQVGSSHALFLVDTSLSSRPDKFNTYLDLLAAILNENRDTLKQFAVVFFNIESHWWQDGYVENTPRNVTRLKGHCHTLALEGATDLKQALAEAARPVWQEDGAKKSPRPDLFLLSDGAITWGDDNLHMIGKTMAAGSAGPLFAYKTGQSGTASLVLEHLTRETGGAVFSIAGEEEITAAATAHRRRPWVLLDVSLEGGSDILVSGRPRTVYPDQQLTVVGRGTPEAAADLMLKLRRGDDLRTVRVPLANTIASELAPRAYGQVSVGQLEDLLPSEEKTAVAYARHFRVAGQSCSLLMLDSEADYQRFQIKPEDDALVVSSFPAAEIVARVLDETAARRTDPKLAFVDWLDRLQTMPGCQVSLPTATKLAIEKMTARVFHVEVPRLVCQARDRHALTDEYSETLDAAQLDYDQVTREAQRRLVHDTETDALKALSCLVERSPGDMVLLRDVAFSSMQWGLGGQAYPLLRRVAVARPYQPQVYTAMARCLTELGQADLALVYFEVALAGQWANRYPDFRQIARMEYFHLLQRIAAGELETCVPDYAAARLASLRAERAAEKYDLVVMMQWNTDRTDVDLHVAEPSGEVCRYDHKTTASGGHITDDVTEGFGPEMYTLANAPEGKYTIGVNYYGGDQNRTSARTKVYLSIYRFFGTPQEQVQRHAVTLERTKDKQVVATVGVGK